jgi:hypothetical protein
MSARLLGLTALLIAASAAPAFAQQADETPICTDRPTKANASCTVPKGALQLETDFYNWSQTKDGDVKATSTLYVNPTVKLGLSDRSDLQVNWAPVARIKVETPLGSVQDTDIGDVFVRYKHRLSADGAKIGFALIPYIKAPTAPLGIGNERWEGGVAAPVNAALQNGFTLTFGPQIDILSELDGTGRRVNFVNLVNLAKAHGKATFYVEFWSATDFAAEGGFDQRSADFAVTYLVAPRLQIDAGVNIGLNDNTPDVQAYVGLSRRF